MLSNKAMGAAKAVEPAYVEDVFSTYLYTGNSATQTITNGIDLAGKGGLVWLKGRSLAVGHYLYDTTRGIANGPLSSENTNAAYTANTPKTLTSFNSNGFSMQDDSATFGANVSPRTQVSWTFRKQPKFFDVVTYTGDGNYQRNISHNLGSIPGCVIIKRTDAADNWWVFHRSLNNISGSTYYLMLQSTAAQDTTGFLDTNTSTTFVVNNGTGNDSGATYVAYLFAHDAGGFGLSGNENVVSCGSFTTDGSGYATVNLGYEPQWILYKRSSAGGVGWAIVDSMRGMTSNYGLDNQLFANTSAAEAQNYELAPTATGFTSTPPTGNALYASSTYIYIAIRRGPMKVPTLGTKVYMPALDNETVTTGYPIDMFLTAKQSGSADNTVAMSRLTGPSLSLQTSSTRAENGSASIGNGFQSNNTFRGLVFSSPAISWAFSRAPSFFDEVCWTGNNGANQRVSHNLGVVPELIIYKGRDKVNYWRAYYGNINKYIALNLSNAEFSGSNLWGSSAPTTTDFGINCSSMDLDNFNAVAYLFATCAGVSKVGSYTGTGTTQAIACGFTAGARFVMIKRTDSTGDWYVWDSARGIVANSDPYLLLNSTAAEVTGTDYIDPSSAGFEISSTAPAAINASGGSYIFLAVA